MIDQSFDLATLRLHYSAGGDPVEIIDSVYRRIQAANDPGIFISLVDCDDAIAAARALGPYDASRPLWGAPFAVKDNIDAVPLPTTAACAAYAYQPSESAFAVQCLVEAGAIMIGKTNLDQFATGLVGVRTPYPIPKNAFDPRIVPGGSSSGSAVAVALGLVSFALGTDTAGSGRVPAALNNIVGLKPSVGAVSTRGVVPACKTLDCVSIFAGCVDDAWRVLKTIARLDDADPFLRPLAFRALGPWPPKTRVGIPRASDLEFFGDGAAAQAWEQARLLLVTVGADIAEVDMGPMLAAAKLLYDGPWIAERHAALRAFLATNSGDVLSVTRDIIEVAKRFSASDTFDALYRLRAIQHECKAIWRDIDILAVPSIPRAPTVAELEGDPIGPNAQLGRWTNFVNLLDLSALAVPGPFRSDGLPAGVTFIGQRGTDSTLANIGRVFHQMAGAGMGKSRTAPPQEVDAPLHPDERIELVVVGAHMSGMALNKELQALGGLFSRTALTEPKYKLFALAGGPPFRPGLLRGASDEGHKIATEVWSLPLEDFARFVSAIPAPLGIGVVHLDDGSRPKGFLVETAGLDGAIDISSFGGWRAYMASRTPN